jgi:hypothetical protein
VHDGTVEVTPGGAAEHAAVSIVTDRQGFIDPARGQATDRLQIQGSTDALDRLQRVFSLA